MIDLEVIVWFELDLFEGCYTWAIGYWLLVVGGSFLPRLGDARFSPYRDARRVCFGVCLAQSSNEIRLCLFLFLSLLPHNPHPNPSL
jgi:hypothetical protein